LSCIFQDTLNKGKTNDSHTTPGEGEWAARPNTLRERKQMTVFSEKIKVHPCTNRTLVSKTDWHLF
jgi:hypothetical protein